MKATVIITEGANTWTSSSEEVYDITALLAVYRDAALSAGFAIGEIAADNDCGDVFWSDEQQLEFEW